MSITSFQDMYLAELQELASVEAQLSAALATMAEKASTPALKEAFTSHKEETETHAKRLFGLLEGHKVDGETHFDESMERLIQESMKMADMVEDDTVRDAGLIASAQKLAHYQIAAYGTAAALAGQLGFEDDQKILHETLEEEKKADQTLTELAKSEVNPKASS